MKIIYAGTPDFAVPALQALIDHDYEIVAVYTQPDRPAGRGRKLTASPVKKIAVANTISVEQPQNFKAPEVLRRLRSYQADIMIVAAYGLILPVSVLDSFQFGCLNIHASLLPRWRGAAPIQRAILAGDEKTGVAIMQMEAGLDTGPYYAMKECCIDNQETGSSLHDKLMKLGAETLLEVLPKVFSRTINAKPQSNNGITYANKLSKQEAEIDWQLPVKQIERQIRAFNAWPVAFSHIGNQLIRIWKAQATSEIFAKEPGTIVAISKHGIDVACKDGTLQIHKVQLPGKKPLSISQLINGMPEYLDVGKQFL